MVKTDICNNGEIWVDYICAIKTTAKSDFYDSDITLYDESRRVVLLVRVCPAEIEALLRPNTLRRDFRALFRLDLQGEEALFRLEEVSEYDPVRGIAKCIFIKECC